MTSPGRPAPGPTSRRPEAIAFGVATVAVVAAFTAEEWGRFWGDVHAWLEPLSAYFEPTLGVTMGPGLPMAVGVAVLVVSYGPGLADRLP